MKRALLLIVFAACCCSASNSDPIYLRHYNNGYGMPSTTVRHIAQDSRGMMWFATTNGAWRFDGNEFTSVYKLSGDQRYEDYNCYYIYADSKDRVWFTGDSGLKIFDGKTNRIIDAPKRLTEGVGWHHQICQTDDDCLIVVRGGDVIKYSEKSDSIVWHCDKPSRAVAWLGDVVYLVFDDQLITLDTSTCKFEQQTMAYDCNTSSTLTIMVIDQSRLLLGTFGDGLLEYDIPTKTLRTIIAKDFVHCFERDSQGRIWVGTESGIYIYDPLSGSIDNVRKSRNNPYGLSDNAIYSLFEDREGGMWIGSYFKGISYMANNPLKYKLFIAGKTHDSLYGNIIRQFCSDEQGNIWVGTEDEGLNCYNPSDDSFVNYSKNNTSHHIGTSNVQGLIAVGNELWIGSYDNGIEVMDLNSRVIKRQYTLNHNGLTSSYVTLFYMTKSQELLVGTENSLLRYNRPNDSFEQLFKETINGTVTHLCESHDGMLWIATSRGLFRFDARANKLTAFVHDPNLSGSLPSNDLTAVIESANNDIYVGTLRGVVRFDAQNNSFVPITFADNALDNAINRIEHDNKNNLWISTNHGIIKYNYLTGKCKRLTESDGLPETKFNRHSSFKDNDGLLYFGSINGFVRIDPSHDYQHSSPTNLVITSFSHTNPSDNQPAYNSFNTFKEPRLKHNQNFVRFNFAALSYSTDNIEYSYSLDRNGNTTQSKRVKQINSIEFQNLSAGHYVFRISSTDATGEWQDNQISFPFTIRPPFYSSAGAYTIYGLIVVSLFVWAFRSYSQRIKKRQEEIEREMEREKQKELYDAKIHFFTTIAHEIRTPLTLIKLPLEQVMESPLCRDEIADKLSLIEKNTNRLTNLCTQLLDFRKVENDKLRLNFIKSDTKKLLEDVVDRFMPLINDRKLSFETELPNEQLVAAVDREAFTKICSNLINNAAKYAQSYIKVKLSLSDDAQHFTLSTINDGEQIMPDDKEHIFSMFYRKNTTQTGSGIGLSLSRQLAQLHGGRLELIFDNDQLNHFMLTMPINQDMMIEDEFFNAAIEPAEETDTPDDNTKQTILIVEDQKDLRNYLEHYFAPYFNTLSAHNGNRAIKLLGQNNVSLIVSDVMMPGIDGMELCKLVKSNTATSHIPFILLTANANMDSKIEGLGFGADDYMEKPFSIKYLHARIDNILSAREKLYKEFTNKPLSRFISQPAENRTEQLFRERLSRLVESELANPDLCVDLLANKLGMSQSALYKKVRGSLDMTLNEYIQLSRLKKGAALILESTLRINEIAFAVGFNSASYFSTCFQKQFGVSPKEFANKGTH